MANYATLKAAIAAAIKQNGNKEITGDLLQQQLLAMVNSLGAQYQFCGIATTETVPGTPDQNVAYLAGPGSYVNFGNITIPPGVIGLFKYNGSWDFEKIFGLGESELTIDKSLVSSDLSFFGSIISANFYNANDSRDIYIRLFGYYSALNAVQLSITKDKSTIIDLRFPADALPSGVQSYYIKNGNDHIKLTINWDWFTNPFNNTNYAFKIINKPFVESLIYDTELTLKSRICGLAQNPTTHTGIVDFIKKIEFYDSENEDINKKYNIVSAGYFSGIDSVQVTVGYNGNNTDFRFTDNNRTGVKIYEAAIENKYLRVTIDWDKWTSNYSTISDVLVFSNRFESNIIPSIDDVIETIGYYNTQLNEQNVLNSVVCPVKPVSAGGKVKKIKVVAEKTGTITLYVGDIDQYLLFIVREQYSIPVEAGTQEIDVSDMGIYVIAGEHIAMQYDGKRYLKTYTGTPTGPNSFFYTKDLQSNPLQLQEYGNPNLSISFGFLVEISESETNELAGIVSKNTKDIQQINTTLSGLISTQNIVSDRLGNKYRLMVVNGNVQALAMEFSHIMCVGNSYTVHPTVDDSAPDYANNLWWGHWAMAASSKNTAWTTLLQTVIRQKRPAAVVTPVFGRRYETGLRALTDDDAFTYWENNAWQNLKPNVSSFSDVDCIVFFLGDNYTGDEWANKYKAMIEQFVVWFPNATVVCCTTRTKPANNEAITTVANETASLLVDMYQLGGASKLGNYVYGDDNLLHQINNSAVAGHFGDYGEYLILNRIIPAIGYENNIQLRNISLTNKTGVVLSVKDTATIPGAVVSVFATINEGATLDSITATSGGSSLVVTDHGVTDYGRIFTFIMPDGDVSVVAN